MYTPKHRGEPVKKWRVHYFESERGWGSARFHSDYDTEEEARTHFENCQAKAGPVPDYYIIAKSIEEITL
jgi:hypothetical protein